MHTPPRANRLARLSQAGLAVILLSALSFSLSPATGAAAAADPSSTSVSGADGNGLDQLVEEKIAELEAAGADVISVSTAPFVSQTTSGSMTTLAYPSGCGLAVIISRNNFTVLGSSLTSCPSNFGSLTHHSRIQSYNPDWGTWREVKRGNKIFTGRPSGASEIAYTCVNANTANYKIITEGTLVYGTTTYYAAAYDQFDANVPCGT